MRSASSNAPANAPTSLQRVCLGTGHLPRAVQAALAGLAGFSRLPQMIRWDILILLRLQMQAGASASASCRNGGSRCAAELGCVGLGLVAPSRRGKKCV